MEPQIIECMRQTDGVTTSADLATLLGVNQRTAQRWLRAMVKSGTIIAEGTGRARQYRLLHPTAAPTFIGSEPAFLEAYVPNQTFYLSEEERRELRAIGMSTQPLPAGTFARRILDRLLIDLSWASSRLEGNTYSLLDTEELLLHGREPDGRTDTETQMVLNHKSAIEHLVNERGPLTFDPVTIRNIHALLSQNLLADSSARGSLRTREVRISGTRYIPLGNPDRIRLAFDHLLQKAATIEDPFEASLFVLVQIPYLQPFIDVNKRVSRLAANIPFVAKNCYPLSFVETSRETYVEAILRIYEHRDVAAMKRLFVTSYRQSADKYAVIAESISAPNPLFLKYHALLKSFVPKVVRQQRRLDQLSDEIESTQTAVTTEELRPLRDLIEVELASLHEGNAITFQLHPSEVVQWRAAGSPM